MGLLFFFYFPYIFWAYPWPDFIFLYVNLRVSHIPPFFVADLSMIGGLVYNRRW